MLNQLRHLISTRTVSAITLALAGSFFAYDIYLDLMTEGLNFHLSMEILVFILILLRLAYELNTTAQLSTALTEEKTRTAHLSGQLNEYIGDQFKTWELSHSEHDIAWLMLKGYTFKEIAGYRNVKEKTVRQQASNIYTKSGNKNRNEFNAFFYEELIEGVEPENRR